MRVEDRLDAVLTQTTQSRAATRARITAKIVDFSPVEGRNRRQVLSSVLFQGALETGACLWHRPLHRTSTSIKDVGVPTCGGYEIIGNSPKN
jgi:hypothetical protein